MSFLTPADFTGKYELHTGMYDVNKLQAYIDKYEGRYFRQLLGVDMYNSLLSDIDQQTNEPKSPNFQFIFSPFAEDVNLFSILDSDGMLDMLKGFIYFEYAKDLLNQMTPYGNVRQKAENSTAILALQSQMYNRYNESVRTLRAIRDYIYLNRINETGQAVEFAITNTGTGYNGANNVTPTPVSGEVLTITIDNPGDLYATTNNVGTTGGSGIGLIVDVVANPAIPYEITSVTINTPGTGYKVGDIILINGGGQNGYIEVTDATNVITGSGMEINYFANPIGEILITNLLTPGTGYVTATSQPTTGGSGSGCLVDINASGGSINDVTIAVGGTQYVVGDILTITGGNADATFIVANILNGEVDLILFENRGSGYNVGDLFAILGDGDDACRFELSYVGIGSYMEYNGVNKALTYWL